MAGPTININAPVGPVAFNTTATGTVAPSTGKTITSMAYQINTGPMTNFLPTGGSWSVVLTTADCPTVGTTYLLTIYAADTGPSYNWTSQNFTRQS